ncbi:hypothetical protein FRC12_002786 [Ceratobasidium sp. 428]|nr:hypothetical protein FRC12_002786 [Ceratobasidium sp. 428]
MSAASTRAGRPSHLKPIIPTRVSYALAYQAETTAGLTPRTPFSSRPAPGNLEDDNEDDDEESYLHVKIHSSPSAPITPLPTRPKSNRDRGAPNLKRRWRFVTWSAILALVVIVLLSLYNVDPRHILMPQASSNAVIDGVLPHGLTTDITHPTRTVPPFHLTERPSASVRAGGSS